MDNPFKISARRRFLRGLLIDQLGRLEDGSIKVHSGSKDVSTSAITLLKQEVAEFDAQIADNRGSSRKTNLPAKK
jgi:hypothetical protein